MMKLELLSYKPTVTPPIPTSEPSCIPSPSRSLNTVPEIVPGCGVLVAVKVLVGDRVLVGVRVGVDVAVFVGVGVKASAPKFTDVIPPAVTVTVLTLLGVVEAYPSGIVSNN